MFLGVINMEVVDTGEVKTSFIHTFIQCGLTVNTYKINNDKYGKTYNI